MSEIAVAYVEGDYTPVPLNTWTGTSASSVQRLVGCPTSFVLPQARDTSEAAARGNILHEFCRTVGENPAGRAQALLDIVDDDIRGTAAGIDLAAALDGIRVEAYERAYVLNVKDRTVRVVGDDIGRKYNEVLVARGEAPLGKYDVPCTMDVVGFVLDGVPAEVDYKSGRSVGEIKDHWQTKVCATILMIHYGTPTAMGRVGYIWEDGSIHADGHEFSCLDIDDFCDEIVEAIHLRDKAKALLATGVMPTLNPSDESCKYCPALTSCPYHMNFLRSLLGELVAIEKGPSLNSLSLEQIGKAFDLYKKAEKILKKVEVAGKLAGKEQPLPIDDKYEYRTKWAAGKAYFDDAKARGEIVKLMSQMGASEDDIEKKLASLKGKGADYPVFSRVKRELPVIQETSTELEKAS